MTKNEVRAAALRNKRKDTLLDIEKAKVGLEQAKNFAKVVREQHVLGIGTGEMSWDFNPRRYEQMLDELRGRVDTIDALILDAQREIEVDKLEERVLILRDELKKLKAKRATTPGVELELSIGGKARQLTEVTDRLEKARPDSELFEPLGKWRWA